MDVTQKRERVKAEIHKVHPLEKDVGGGSGHLSYSRLGDMVIGESAADGSFAFAAEVSRESEFGGSTHWFKGVIGPGSQVKIESLQAVTQQFSAEIYLPDDVAPKKKGGRKGPKPPSTLSVIRSNRRELGLPVLGAYECKQAAQAELRKHLKIPESEYFVVKCRTGRERVDGDTDSFDFAAIRWEGKERAKALWYVGTVRYSLKTDKATAKIKEHAKSGVLVRHPNFNANDLHKAEERIWSELGFADHEAGTN